MSRIYEFNFDELTIGDFVFIQRAIRNPEDPDIHIKIVEMIPRFTNTDVMALPVTEIKNVTEAFISALSQHFYEVNKGR